MDLNHLLLISTYAIINLREVESNCPQPEIWPKDPFLYENEQLILSCTIKDKSKGTLELRRMEKNQNDGGLPNLTTINNKTHLTIQFNEIIQAPTNPYWRYFFYKCEYKSTNCSEMEKTTVYFDAYPRKPEHISCVIYDTEGIKCKINLGGPYRLEINSGLTKEINVTVKMQAPLDINRYNWILGDCTPRNKKTFVFCTWNADSKPYTLGRYAFNVSVVNTVRNDSVYSILEEDVYVKPALVRNVTITTNTTALEVTWTHEFKGLVEYETQLIPNGTCGETTKTQHTVENSVVFNNLESYFSYNISIIAYPVNEDRKRLKYDSDPVYSQTMTKADVPAINPMLHLGSFHIADDGQVYIFWKPLKDCQANGPGLVYEISLFGPNDLPLSNETKTAAEFTATLSISRSGTYRVYIKSHNSAGYAIQDQSHLQISNQRPQFPRSFIVEWIRNRTVLLSWLPLESSTYDISDYTVYWCRANDSYICNEPINTHVVLSNTTTTTVTINRFDFDKHIFGVSAEMETSTGQLISSGIHWSTCYYRRYALPSTPMETALKYTDDGVNITWETYPCSRSYGRTMTSMIYIKNDQNRLMKKINVSSSKGFFIVKNMPPGRYRFSIAGEFPGGKGPTSKDISFLIEGEISWALIIPVAVGGLIIVAVLIVTAVKIRNYCKKATEDTRKIDLVEVIPHSTPPDESLIECLEDSGISTFPSCEQKSNAYDQHDETTHLLHEMKHTKNNLKTVHGNGISAEPEQASADSDEDRYDLADYVVTTQTDVETAEMEITTKDRDEGSSTETIEMLSKIKDENDIQDHDNTTESMINCQGYVTVDRMNSNYCKNATEDARKIDLVENLGDSGISTIPSIEHQSNVNDQHDETTCLLHEGKHAKNNTNTVHGNDVSAELKETSSYSDEVEDDLGDYVKTTQRFDLDANRSNEGILQTTNIESKAKYVSEVYVERSELENKTKDQNEESTDETTQLLSKTKDENDKIQDHDETTESQPMINCQDYVTVDVMNK